MPRPKKHSSGHELLTQADIADVFGCSQETICNLTKAGTLMTKAGLMYPLRENARRMVAALRVRHQASTSKLRLDTLAEEKLRLEIDKIKRTVLPRAELELAWSDVLLSARQQLLSLGNRLGPRLLFCKSEAEIQGEIDREIRAVLTELAAFKGSSAGGQEELALED